MNPANREEAVVNSCPFEDEWKASGHKRSKKLSTLLFDWYSSSTNPYAACIEAFSNCHDFRKNRPGVTLAIVIMQCLQDWIRSDEERVKLSRNFWICPSIHKRLIDVLFRHSTSSNIPLIELALKVFCVDSNSASYIGDAVNRLLQRRLYAEAAILTQKLGLQRQYISEFAVPLLFLDRIPLLEANLENEPELQRDVIVRFDSLFDDQESIHAAMRRYQIQNVKRDRLTSKALSKLVTRLLKKYSLSPDLCPRLCMSRNRSAMRYLIIKKYRENDVSEVSWREMICEAVGTCRELHIELLNNIVYKNDYPCALYFALKLDVPYRDWPSYLRDICQDDPRMVEEMRAEMSAQEHPDAVGALSDTHLDDNNAQYLQLRLPLSKIFMVDTAEKFEDALRALEGSPIIGVDAEWKPTMGFMMQTRLSLVQLATRDAVYLIDVLALGTLLTRDEWDGLYDRVLGNKQVTKLGFGINEDLRKLNELCSSGDVENFVDLSRATEKLGCSHPLLLVSVDSARQQQYKGLSELTNCLLGRPLCKDEQCSDWEKRPLRSTQLIYAALDAFCLLEVFDILDSRARLHYGASWAQLVEESAQNHPPANSGSAAPGNTSGGGSFGNSRSPKKYQSSTTNNSPKSRNNYSRDMNNTHASTGAGAGGGARGNNMHHGASGGNAASRMGAKGGGGEDQRHDGSSSYHHSNHNNYARAPVSTNVGGGGSSSSGNVDKHYHHHHNNHSTYGHNKEHQHAQGGGAGGFASFSHGRQPMGGGRGRGRFAARAMGADEYDSSLRSNQNHNNVGAGSGGGGRSSTTEFRNNSSSTPFLPHNSNRNEFGGTSRSHPAVMRGAFRSVSDRTPHQVERAPPIVPPFWMADNN